MSSFMTMELDSVSGCLLVEENFTFFQIIAFFDIKGEARQKPCSNKLN
jgi:hypothetical protein